MKRASIDLGTNTCLLLIQECSDEGETVLHDESNIVRLGEGVASSGKLSLAAMERAQACLQSYTQILRQHEILGSNVVAVATAQARDASNATAFFDSIEQATGIRFRILSGDEEAKATFLGAAPADVQASRSVVMDIGGGSTELVAIPVGKNEIFGESLSIGAVKLTELYLKSDPVTDEEYWQCEAAIDQALQKMKSWRQTLHSSMSEEPVLISVAGTAVTLAMLQEGLEFYDQSKIDGVTLTQGDVHRLVEELKWRTVEERKRMPGMEAKRADVILAGSMIFWRVMEELSFKEARVSTRGLRYGVFELSK
ncbi:MAG: Ppx/GppA family phosphatase [Bdellovibrionales bacterium]|nr:Ppx/GppA family phosphatase [Oligoflexia bacterium]